MPPISPDRQFAFGRRRCVWRRLSCEVLEARRLLAVMPAGFAEVQVVQGLTSPTALDAAPDGRVFVAQQDGTIHIVENDLLLAEPFARLPVDGSGERGLQGLELDPGFSANGFVYVYYTAASPGLHNRVSRLTADPTRPDKMLPGSEMVLFELPLFSTLPGDASPQFHMGGALQVAGDGTLLVQVGDHFNPPLAQDLDSPIGKILRMNVDGSAPATNPYYNAADGVTTRDYVWSLGLRNPFSGDIDPVTGTYLVGDVGSASWEEINDATTAGANFGWPLTEGPFDPAQHPALDLPLYAYDHQQDCAITGGAFYRPAQLQFPQEYAGKYFFSQFCAGRIQYFDPADPAAPATTFASGISFPLNLEAAPDGSLYYLARGAGAGGEPGIGTGGLFKIVYASGPPRIVDPPDSLLVSIGYAAEFRVAAAGAAPISFQWQRQDAGGAAFVDIPGAVNEEYRVASTSLADNGARFRVVATNASGSVASAEAELTVTENRPPLAVIDAPAAGARYRAGDVISFSGQAADPEDGPLGAEALAWRVDFHHGSHAHPFLPLTAGASSGEFVAPLRAETDPDVFFRIHLQAVDLIGLTHQTFVDVLPWTANLTLATNPPGLLLRLDDRQQSAPLTTTGVARLERVIEAPLLQTVDGQTYRFARWSNGGPRRQTISFPDADATLTAEYQAMSSTFLSDLPFAQPPINGWGPVERDMSNGEDSPGDGRPITLAGVTYAKGLGVHAHSEMRFDLAGAYQRFVADLGVDDEAAVAGVLVFQVFGDGEMLFDSGPMNGASPTQTIDLDVAGRQELRLVTLDGGDGIDSDHGDWADARLLREISNEQTVWLSDLPFAAAPINGWGPIERDMSNGEDSPGDGRPITLAGVTYAKGLGAHAHSDAVFDLNGAYSRFLSDVGIDDEATLAGYVVFRVYADDELLFDSGPMNGASPTQSIDISVAGRNQLRLTATDGGDGIDSDHADWAGARLLSAVAPAGVTFTPAAAAVAEAGPSASYSVRLNSRPFADVSVALDPGSQLAVSPSVLVFTPANWSEPQTVTVTAVDDVNYEGDHQGAVAHTLTSDDVRYHGLSVNDYLAEITDNDPDNPYFRSGVLSGVTDAWTTVTLDRSYANMVVVASAAYSRSSIPLVTRVRNADGASFQVRVERTDRQSAAFPGVTVHYVVLEAGLYTQAAHGVKLEAVKFQSTITDRKGAYNGQLRSYLGAYSQPVVVGQVMSAGDADWSAFWARGATASSPPSATVLRVGKHVGEDADVTRANETIGYVVFEAGLWNMAGQEILAGVGAQTVRGVENAPPYNYALSGLNSAQTAVVASAGMAGADGGWPVLYGASPVSSTRLQLAIDEDAARDAERSHGAERVAYLVFGGAASRIAGQSLAAESDGRSPVASLPLATTPAEVRRRATSDPSPAPGWSKPRRLPLHPVGRLATGAVDYLLSPKSPLDFTDDDAIPAGSADRIEESLPEATLPWRWPFP